MHLKKNDHSRDTESYNTRAERSTQWRSFIEAQSMKLAFGTALIAFAVVVTLVVSHNQGPLKNSRPAAASTCQFQKADQPVSVAFCDSFDQPMGTGNRSGDLNGDVWGVSRTTSETGFGGGGEADVYFQSKQIQPDGTTKNVLAPHDITINNGILIDSVNDGGLASVSGGFGAFTILGIYPKQPFDIAGRTGTVTFDVSANSENTHAAWPLFVYTDQPVPSPYDGAAAERPFARNSFGFSLSPTGTGSCQSVADVFVTRNYADFSGTPNNQSGLGFTYNDTNCIKAPTQPGQLNHIEVRMSLNHIEVWGSDAGTTTLKQMMVADNVNLPLTRGLVWMGDAHYNACKDGSQCDHTIFWDNLGFDGPVLPRDWAVDVNDKGTSIASSGTCHCQATDLGWSLASGGTTGALPLVTPIGADKIAQASSAILTLNFGPQGSTTLTYRVNGNAWHTQAWPFTDNGSDWSWRTLAVPVPLSEVNSGSNTVEVKSSAPAVVANLDLILVGGGGVPTCYNPSNCAGSQYSGGGGGTTDTTAPSVPTNLHSTGTTNSSVSLAWTASTDNSGGTGLAGYKLYRNGTLIASIPSSTTTYTDTGLSPSTSYSYAISAYDNAGNESARSSTVSATTTGTTAGIPGDCNADGHVTITDMSLMLSHYNGMYNSCDFNNDANVNILDLSILISNYGR